MKSFGEVRVELRRIDPVTIEESMKPLKNIEKQRKVEAKAIVSEIQDRPEVKVGFS